jgi:hypothetical protein
MRLLLNVAELKLKEALVEFDIGGSSVSSSSWSCEDFEMIESEGDWSGMWIEGMLSLWRNFIRFVQHNADPLKDSFIAKPQHHRSEVNSP